jgi:protein subunit release factor B
MSSLQQLFTTQFDVKAIKQVRLMNGNALLYKRLQSSQWQVRFKLANNKWHSTTTNTDDIEQAKINALKGDNSGSWGNQMRSYVLAPYQMVKDLRTDFEVGNPSAVLDGEIDGFIEAGIKWRKSTD